GSPKRIAAGVHIAGVDVGGMKANDAQKLLERRAAAFQNRPVVFTAPGHTWRLKPGTLGVEVEGKGAVEASRRQGDGFGPFRGFRRIGVRFFGAEVSPPATV